jgi:uncharacterized protein YkwD
MQAFLSRKSPFDVVYVVMCIGVGYLACIVLPALSRAQTPRASAVSQSDVVTKELLDAHNRLRTKEGLAALKLNPKLMNAALAHAQDMAQHETLSHQGSDGTTPAQRVQRQGYTYQQTAENVAMGQPTPAAVMQAWLHSPPHRHNIFSDFTETGAARAFSDNGVPYWCVVFGTPVPKLDRDQAAATAVELLNQARSKKGLSLFAVDTRLEHAAQAQVRTIAAHDRLQTATNSDTSPLEQIGPAGSPFRMVGQIVAANRPTPQAVVQSILDNKAYHQYVFGKFNKIGVGYGTAEDGTPYWCFIFGTT